MSLNLVTFLPRLQHKLDNTYQLQRNTVDSIHGFLDLMCDDLMTTMLALNQLSGRQTADVKTLQCAIQLCFPEGLSAFAISAGTVAVTRYNEYMTQLNSQHSPTPVADVLPPDELGDSKHRPDELGDSKHRPDELGDSKHRPDGSPPPTRVSRSAKSKLVFPVNRMIPLLKRTADRVQPMAAVFLAAVVEFIASELLESSAESTSGQKRKQINVYDLHRSVWGDKGVGLSTLSSWMSGDAEMQKLAQRIKWGNIQTGWKGVYTSQPTNKRKKIA